MEIINLLLNIILVSIPEEFIMTMIMLVVLRQWQFLSKEFWKINFIKIMITSVLPIAIITNITKFIVKIDSGTQLLMSTILFIITISILINIKTIKQFFKTCGFIIISIALFILSELITAFICKYGLKIDIVSINLNPYLIFSIAIPERIIQYGCILFIFIKKNSLVQINLLNMIKQNILLRNIIVLFTTIDIIMIIIMLKYVFIENILYVLTFNQQLVIIIMGFSMIILFMLSMWIYIICIFPFEKYKQNQIKEEFFYEKNKHHE
jgi:hypothetical protein